MEVPVSKVKEPAPEVKEAMETDGQPGDAKMEDVDGQAAEGATENGVPVDEKATKMETEPAKVGQHTTEPVSFALKLVLKCSRLLDS